jgi:hypothetical protein
LPSYTTRPGFCAAARLAVRRRTAARTAAVRRFAVRGFGLVIEGFA